MARDWIHTVHRDDLWLNEVEEGAVISHRSTKEEAVEAGRREAKDRRTEHVIHNMDGTIAEQNSYGSDPNRPLG
jgi:hypothetical protein